MTFSGSYHRFVPGFIKTHMNKIIMSSFSHILLFSIAIAGISSCGHPDQQEVAKQRDTLVSVKAIAETTPMPDAGDAADDPAIWVNPADPLKSLIIGTNKKKGLAVYDLNGTLLADYPVGRINNVDIRYGFPLGDKVVDLVAGSNRTDNSILVMMVDPVTLSLMPVPGSPIRTTLKEVYGFSLYHHPGSHQFYAILGDKDGKVEQWELTSSSEGVLQGTLVQTIILGSQTEGVVADDVTGNLFIGEEDRGIWKYRLTPLADTNGVLVDSVGGGHLVDDVEGLAIYMAGDHAGYLIASSQGNNSFAVYDRAGDHKYLGTFSIVDGDSIDGVFETDGIEVHSLSLDSRYPAGIFIAQDGANTSGLSPENQNFKLVSFGDVLSKLGLPAATMK